MTTKITGWSDEIFEYVNNTAKLPNPYIKDVLDETSSRKDAEMAISGYQAAFMHLMAKSINAKKILEVGCFVGTSAIAMATGLSEGGKLITLDMDKSTEELAKKNFINAGVSEKISYVSGDALQSMDQLITDGQNETFDMVFIDADKENYEAYYEKSLMLLRKNGLILVDNTLWSGTVIDDADNRESTVAIRNFNKKRLQDKRVDGCLLPISDGIYVLRKI